jgi:hypothetical protein
MSALKLAERAVHSVWLQKYSTTSFHPDVQSECMPEDMRAAFRSRECSVGSVWRARVGRTRRWWYGWTGEEALTKALFDAGVK